MVVVLLVIGVGCDVVVVTGCVVPVVTFAEGVVVGFLILEAEAAVVVVNFKEAVVVSCRGVRGDT